MAQTPPGLKISSETWTFDSPNKPLSATYLYALPPASFLLYITQRQPQRTGCQPFIILPDDRRLSASGRERPVLYFSGVDRACKLSNE